jgi:hypothetical protein
VGVTEIYSCRPGQKLKEGRLDYSSDITCKEEAEVDALRRVKLDPGLAKVAYYQVTEDGRFRVIHSYTNPNPSAAKPARAGMGTGPRRPTAAKPVPKPKTFLQKIGAIFRRGR